MIWVRVMHMVSEEQDVWIGLLAYDSERSVRQLRLYEQAKPSGTSLIAFAPGDIDWERQQVRGLTMQRHNRISVVTRPLPHVVYNRIYLSGQAVAKRLDQMIGPDKVFNMHNQLDKWQYYTALHQSDLARYVPRTARYNLTKLIMWLQRGHIVFLKPSTGLTGKGVYRLWTYGDEIYGSEHRLRPSLRWSVRDKSLVDRLRQLTEGKPCLIQEGIDGLKVRGSSFDIRAYVQKGRGGRWGVSCMISRIADRKYFNTSMTKRITSAPRTLRVLFSNKTTINIVQEMTHVSLQTAKIMEKTFGHLGEACVDYTLDQQGRLWIIDVNGMPQKSILGGHVGKQLVNRVYRMPLDYAVYLASR